MNDDRNNLLKAIEKMNIDYIKLQNSKEYLLGKRLLTIKNLLKHFHFIQIAKRYIKLKKINPLLSYQDKDNTEDVYDDFFEIDSDIKNTKIVIYTAIIGNYDKVQEPYIKEKNVKYVLYTDNRDIQTKNWEVRTIPGKVKKLNNPILINRYIKMHPKELFPNYNYAFYIDGNVKIVSNITELIKKVNKKTGLALHRHKARKCAYDEINTCILVGKGKKEELEKTKKIFTIQNFPRNYGLCECNLILSDLDNKNSTFILDKWWDFFINSECYRDQIYFPYVLWKNNYQIDDIGNLGNNIYRNGKIRIINHI